MSRRNNEAKAPEAEESKSGAGAPEESGSGSPSNKVSGRFAQLLESASKLSTAYATGAKIAVPVMAKRPDALTTSYVMKLDTFNDVAPGIMVYDWVPTIGVSKDNTSPANLAMAEIASFIKSQVNRRPSWETPDLAITMLAIDSIYSLHFNLMRVYGLLNRYTATNKYWPRAIVEALGYDFDDFVDNQVNLLFMLQQRAAELRRFALPATFRLFERHLRYNTLVYADGETDKAQLYAMNQCCYWSYEVVDQVKGLTPIRTFSPQGHDVDPSVQDPEWEKLKFADVKKIYNRMLTALRNSADVDDIVGDIISAYGDAAISLVPDITADYVTPIVYDSELLCSINNACVFNADTASLRVEDRGGNFLYCAPRCHISSTDGAWVSSVVGNIPYLNFKEDVPSAVDVVNAMMFHSWIENVDLLKTTAGAKPGMVYGTKYDFAACGTELLTDARMYILPSNTAFRLENYSSWTESADVDLKTQFAVYHVPTNLIGSGFNPDDGTVLSHMTEALLAIARLSCFKAHHPVMVTALQIEPNITGNFVTSSPYVCATQNRVPVTSENAEQIFTALLYDAFFN